MVFLVVLNALGELIVEKQDNYGNLPCALPLAKCLIYRIYLFKVSVEVQHCTPLAF